MIASATGAFSFGHFVRSVRHVDALQEHFRLAILSDQCDTWMDNARKFPDLCPMTDCYNLVCNAQCLHCPVGPFGNTLE